MCQLNATCVPIKRQRNSNLEYFLNISERDEGMTEEKYLRIF